jgi:hypothetical protein
MPKKSTIRMRSYVTAVMGCGLAAIVLTAGHLKEVSPTHLIGLLCASAVASRLSLKIPRLTASLSLDVPFVILAAVQMGFAAAVLVAAVSTLIQCFKRDLGASGFVKVFFNVAALAIAAGAAAGSVRFGAIGLNFAAAGAMLLITNSVLIAVVVSLDGHGNAAKIWSQLVSWSFPAYVLGAGIACLMAMSQPVMGWYVPLLTLPVMVLVYQSYRKYFGSAASLQSDSAAVEQQPEEVMA